MNLNELPADLRKYIRGLRSENVKYRRERNEARQELAALRAEMKADAGSLVQAGLMVCGYGGAVCSRCKGDSPGCYRALV